MLIPIAEIQEAQKRIQKYLKPTPLIFSRHFSEVTGCKVFLKLETLQPTHSFKVRGALNAILALPEQKRSAGVVTASGGNHGLGVALACAKMHTTCTIYLPLGTPKIKIDAISKLGAKVILHGEAWDDANLEATRIANVQGLAYIHAFDDLRVMAGQGTIFLELHEQLKNIDLVVTSIGGGGLISGLISAAQHLSPSTRIAGVEPEGANSMAASIHAKKIVELPAITSICESLGARKTSQRQFDIVSKHIREIAVVTDRQAISSLFDVLTEEKLLVEPAAACSITALTHRKIHFDSKETIVVILCGGNVSLAKVFEWYQKQSS